MTFLSALVLGLVASAHCAGMCGGLQIAMQAADSNQVTIRSPNGALVHLLLLNLGRIITYVSAGIVFASLGYAVLAGLDISAGARFLRIATGLIIFTIGLQVLLGKQRPFQFIEPLGVAAWRRVSGIIDQSNSRKSQSLVTGIAWGFLPCGLVYSVLLATVFSGDIVASALIMLGFGLGTMPALLFSGLLYKRFREVIKGRFFQQAGGLFFMTGGVLVLSAPYWINRDFLNNYPQLLNQVFCLT